MPAEAGVGAGPKLNLAFPQIVAEYDSKRDTRKTILTPEEMKVYRRYLPESGFTGGINWYRNMTRNWRLGEDLDHVVRVPSLMIMAEMDGAAALRGRRHGKDRAGLGEASRARQRSLDAAGKARRGERDDSRLAPAAFR